MFDTHALDVFRHAAQNGLGLSGIRQAVRDYLAEKDTHLSGLALDRYMSRLVDAAWAELKPQEILGAHPPQELPRPPAQN